MQHDILAPAIQLYLIPDDKYKRRLYNHEALGEIGETYTVPQMQFIINNIVPTIRAFIARSRPGSNVVHDYFWYVLQHECKYREQWDAYVQLLKWHKESERRLEVENWRMVRGKKAEKERRRKANEVDQVREAERVRTLQRVRDLEGARDEEELREAARVENERTLRVREEWDERNSTVWARVNKWRYEVAETLGRKYE